MANLRWHSYKLELVIVSLIDWLPTNTTFLHNWLIWWFFKLSESSLQSFLSLLEFPILLISLIFDMVDTISHKSQLLFNLWCFFHLFFVLYYLFILICEFLLNFIQLFLMFFELIFHFFRMCLNLLIIFYLYCHKFWLSTLKFFL